MITMMASGIRNVMFCVTSSFQPAIGRRRYCYAVGNRMQVLITDHEYAPYGRVLINLVDQVVERLGSPWLRWSLVGFKEDGECKD
jgi:hypothetical protein